MCSQERIYRVVVKRRWRPSDFRVAGRTIRGKLLSAVVRAGRLRIIVCVTAVAGVGRCRIITVVASGTII